MAVHYVTVASGTTASSAVMVDRGDRAVALAVSSHAALGWHLAFQATAGGPWLRLATAGTVTPVFSGAAGAWGVVPYPPTGAVRIETSAAVSATTSCALTEVLR